MQLSVVIPTYNERENIPHLVEGLSEVLKNIRHEIILVDDNSQDGTAKIAERYSEKCLVKVLVRTGERDLSLAVMDGIKNAKSELICVMDADLQHPPNAVLNLYKAATKRKADITIGSRYTRNGQIVGWGKVRLMVSLTAKNLARFLFPKLKEIQDPLSGFFIIRKPVIEASLNPTGYKLLLEILVNGNYQRVVEVPYKFSARTSGKSKMNLKQIIKYLQHLRLLLKKRGKIGEYEYETA